MTHPHARPTVDPTNPASIAGDILARIASYDTTAPIPTPDLIRDWAEMIRAAHIEHQWLVEGVGRVYLNADGDPPKSKLSAIIAAARQARARHREGQALRELAAGPSFDDNAPRRAPIAEAYEVDEAILLECPECGAGEGALCGPADMPATIPHIARLGLAYRTNNPKGIAQHAARRAHLREHRRTFTPTWKRKTA